MRHCSFFVDDKVEKIRRKAITMWLAFAALYTRNTTAAPTRWSTVLLYNVNVPCVVTKKIPKPYKKNPEGSLKRTTIFTYHEPDQFTYSSNFLHFNNIVKSTSVFPDGLLIQICQSNPKLCFSSPSHVLHALPNSFSLIIMISNLSNDRSKPSCKTVPPQSAI